MTKRLTDILRKIAFSIVLGAASFLIIYFILENFLPKEDLKKITVIYKSSSKEQVQFFLKFNTKTDECVSSTFDTLDDGKFSETFIIPEITPYHKFNIVFGKNDHLIKLYSVLFQYSNSHAKWGFKKLATNFDADFRITNNSVEVLGSKPPLKIACKKTISDIIQKHELFRLTRYSLLLSSVVFLFFLFYPFKIYQDYSLKELVLVFMFLGIIYVPLMINYHSFTNSEKRILTAKPQVSLKNILSYHREYGKYFSDNFSFRNTLIKLNNNLTYRLFNISPVPEKVLIGKKDWLFHTEENSLDLCQNGTLYSNEELEKIKINLEKQRDWLKERNIKFYILVPPIKARIYPEYLPDNLNQIHSMSKLQQLKDYLLLNSDIRILDPTAELVKQKANKVVYYSNDTHWNYYGAFIGYEILISEIAKDFKQITPLELKDFDYINVKKEGDLAIMMGINRFLITKEDKPIYKYPSNFKYNSDIVNTLQDKDFLQPPVLVENNDTTLLKVIFFRDSFSNFYISYFAEHFSRCLYLWTHTFKPTIIEKGKPDIVIHEIHEKFLDDLLKESAELENN